MIRLPNLSPTSLANVAAPQVDVSGGTNTIARAISEVSDGFTTIARDIAKADNARKESEFRQTLAADFATLQSELMKEPDPAARVDRTTRFLQERSLAVDNPEFPPVLRERVRSYYDDFATTARIRSAQEAAEVAMTKARKAIGNEIDAAIRYGDRAAMETAVDTGIVGNLIDEEDLPKLWIAFDEHADETFLFSSMESDPAGVLRDTHTDDFLERFPGISTDRVPRIRSQARAIIQERRGQELDIIEARILEGTLQPEDLEAAEYLTETDIARAKKAFETEDPPPGAEHLKAWEMLIKQRETFLDPSVSDAAYAETWNETRAAVLALIPPKWQGDLNQEIYYRSPANRRTTAADPNTGSTAPRGRSRQDFRTLATARIKAAYDAGTLGVTTDPKSAAARKAFDTFEDVRVEVWNFIEDHPNATWPDIRDFIDKTVNTPRLRTNAAALQSFIPGSGQRLRSPQPATPYGPAVDENGFPIGADVDLLPPLPPREQLDEFIDPKK